MSRLDSAIRRLTAQRDALDWAAARIAGLDGPVLELGLGNGRTYDHLRGIMPDREIFVFERRVAAHPDCIPDPEHLFEGDFSAALPRAARSLAGQAALAHLDIGTGVKADSMALAARIAPMVARLLRPGALVISDQDIADWAALRLAGPPGIPEGRLHFFCPVVGATAP